MAEEETPGPGHNGADQAERDRITVMISLARRCNDVESEIAERRDDLKSIKGEGKQVGIKAKHIKMAQEMLNADKEAVITEDMKIRHALMKALNIDLGYQMEMFEDRRPDVDRATAQGRADGLAGKSLENPYVSGPQMGAYATAWHAAQKELGEAMQRRMEDALAKEKEKEEAKKRKADEGKEGGGATPSEEEVDAAKQAADIMNGDGKSKAIEAAGKASQPKKGKSNAEKAADMAAAAEAAKNKEGEPADTKH